MLVGKKNQRNFSFNRTDTAAIIEWINKHLSIRGLQLSPAPNSVERRAIRLDRPLLNIRHSPELSLSSLHCERNAEGWREPAQQQHKGRRADLTKAQGAKRFEHPCLILAPLTPASPWTTKVSPPTVS